MEFENQTIWYTSRGQLFEYQTRSVLGSPLFSQSSIYNLFVPTQSRKQHFFCASYIEYQLQLIFVLHPVDIIYRQSPIFSTITKSLF